MSRLLSIATELSTAYLTPTSSRSLEARSASDITACVAGLDSDVELKSVIFGFVPRGDCDCVCEWIVPIAISVLLSLAALTSLLNGLKNRNKQTATNTRSNKMM